MLSRLSKTGGVTLTEQLLSVLLGSVVVTSLYAFFRTQLFQLTAQETKTATLQDARGALDLMVHDLKNAGSWGTGRAPAERGGADDPERDADGVCNRVYAATQRFIHVQMDLNGNDRCDDSDPRENIKHELGGPTATCQGPNTIWRNGDCLVANVSTAPNGKLFTFFDEHGRDLGNAPPLGLIKRVRIQFSVQVKHPNPQVGGNLNSTVGTSVLLRN
jgi:hypothetical protein